jgi:hypothetical protein
MGALTQPRIAHPPVDEGLHLFNIGPKFASHAGHRPELAKNLQPDNIIIRVAGLTDQLLHGGGFRSSKRSGQDQQTKRGSHVPDQLPRKMPLRQVHQ